MSARLLAPYPYFGGKSLVADVVWNALGRVKNYVEPFYGSGAVHLARPRSTWFTASDPGIETVNDASRFLCNFWRSAKTAPDEVATWADWPVSECDLHARHSWLLAQLPALAVSMDGDPDYYDAKIAGWWAWGASCWIGDRWCVEQGVEAPRRLPYTSGSGRGVKRKSLRAPGAVREYFAALCDRLRHTRVTCGDWSRVVTPAVTWRQGLTGVFLDPPYAEGAQQYAAGGTGTDLSARVREWAIEAGERRDVRIVLAGYEGEHDLPASWRVIPWRARGGYANNCKNKGENNRLRERLWLSPHCLSDRAELALGERL